MTPRPWETRKFHSECAWPIDTPDGVYSCCDPVAGERPYCPAHCAKMYAPAPPARRHRRKL